MKLRNFKLLSLNMSSIIQRCPYRVQTLYNYHEMKSQNFKLLKSSLYSVDRGYRFKDTLIPRHPCLDLEWCCEQPLQRLVGRRLIVMEKRQRWSSELQGQAMASREHDKFRDKYFTQFTSSLPHTTS